MFKPLDPRDHYWNVGEGKTTKIYSSERNIYVPKDDAKLAEFTKAGGITSAIPDEKQLWGVVSSLAMGYLPDWLFNGEVFVQSAQGVFSKDQLTAYAAMKRWELEVAGTRYDSVDLRTDRTSRTSIDQTLIYLNAQQNKATVNWKTLDGFQKWDKDKLGAASAAINAHVQKAFDTEQKAQAGVADGTIKSTKQIDDMFDSAGNVKAK